MRFHRSGVRFMKKAASRLRHVLLSASGLVQPLPAGFDPERYLELNPDVKKAGIDPALHYMRFGHREGRPDEVLHDTVVEVARDADALGLRCLNRSHQQSLPLLG